MNASGGVDTLLCRESVLSAPSQLRQLDSERPLRGLSLPIHVSVASSKKRKKKRLRKRWQILLVWLSILVVCGGVWMMIFDVLGDDVYRANENSILGGIIFTTIALIAAVALTIGILDSRGHM